MVSGEYPANHVLVDFNAEGQSDMLGDSGTTAQGIPLLHLDHGFNLFLSGSPRTGLGPDFGGEQRPVFSFLQRLVEVQESRRLQLQNDRGSDQAAGTHQQCAQPSDQSEIRRFGDRWRERLSISNCRRYRQLATNVAWRRCLTKTDSATTERTPPAPSGRASVAMRWTKRIISSRMTAS